MTKHTPGPWTYNFMNFRSAKGEEVKTLGIFSKDGGYIAKLHPLDFNSFEQVEANAALIAAAPELLEALEYVFASGQPLLTTQAIVKMQCAIAKAKGE